MRLTDAQLLTRFAEGREEGAFAALVQRHGPMVLGVCRRVLTDDQDAEDAFQATFLVLARRAGAIRDREAVASWLYGVAVRLAAKLRCQAGQRRARERQFLALQPSRPGPDLLSFVIWQELKPVLDEELGRLPEKYRSPLVLCYLEGKSHDEAAAELGWPKGSMSRRMDKARTLLRDRLAQRGITLSAGVILGVLAQHNVAIALAEPLVQQTLQAAVAFAAKPVAVTGLITPSVASLAQGALQTMSWSIGKLVAGSLLTLALLGGTAGLFTFPADAQQPGGSGPAGLGSGTGSGTPPTVGSGGGAPLKSEDVKAAGKPPQTKPEKSAAAPNPSRSLNHREVHQVLDQRTNYFERGYKNAETLDTVLNKIADDFKLTIRCDYMALRRANVTEENFQKTEIKFPGTKDVTLRQVLKELLFQVQEVNGALTFVVRGNQVVIEPMVSDNELVPADPREASDVLRGQVSIAVEGKSLREALRDLAEATGTNIVVDNRLAETANMPVTVSLQNVPLITAVRLLADMAEVKVVTMDNVIYVTTAENAAKIERERNPQLAGGGAGLAGPPGLGGGGTPGGPAGVGGGGGAPAKAKDKK
jgi:RNA polymerase sigma factor (sigma-70 family)